MPELMDRTSAEGFIANTIKKQGLRIQLDSMSLKMSSSIMSSYYLKKQT